MAGEDQAGSLQVSQEDFLGALSALVPSVSPGELQYYQELKATLQGGQ